MNVGLEWFCCTLISDDGPGGVVDDDDDCRCCYNTVTAFNTVVTILYNRYAPVCIHEGKLHVSHHNTEHRICNDFQQQLDCLCLWKKISA